MVYVLAVVVLLLAAAVVALFAMLGELYVRVGGPIEATPVLSEARLGERPAAWPKELADLATAPESMLLVLSTSCASCTQVAGQLDGSLDLVDGRQAAIALSTPDPARAEDFVQQHGLPRRSVYVDVEGAWVTKTFGVQTSPSALFLESGALSSARIFTDVKDLRAAAATTQSS